MINFRNLFLSLPLLFCLTACESDVNGERCIGVNDKEKSGIEYEVSTTNVVLAVIFSETIFVPLIVLFKELKCPIPTK